MNRPTATTFAPPRPVGVPVTQSPVRPTPQPRVVFVGGELIIDGVVVCPTCSEDKGSPFCRCTPDDLLVELDLASLREMRRAA